MDNPTLSEALLRIYRRLLDCYGPQHWWPGDSPFEVMVGAILTQSAAWSNVAKAIANLKEAGALSPDRLRQLCTTEIGELIHPSGYYNAKALKLKSLVCWLGEAYNDNLKRLFNNDTASLREQLLSVHGIGDETADSIILYAANKPVFVIDAYTRRIMGRIGLMPERGSYSFYHRSFMDNLPADTILFNEYHALLVRLGKEACHRQPLCQNCCLNYVCKFGKLGGAGLSDPSLKE